MNFLRSESFKKGMLLSAGFNLFAKLIGFLNSLCIAYFFGTQASMDVYFFGIGTVTAVVGFFNSISQSVIIPEAMRLRTQVNEEVSRHFFNFTLYLHLAFFIIIVSLSLLSPIGLFKAISGFNNDILIHNISLLKALIISVFLSFFITYFTEILATFKYFTIPMLVSFVNSVFSLSFVVCFHEMLGVNSIVWGLLSAQTLNLLMLVFILCKFLKWKFSFQLPTLEKHVLNNIGYSLVGSITSTVFSYIPLVILSRFGEGTISALNYGKMISEIPNQFVTTNFSVVAGIKFNELVSKNNLQGLNNVFLRSVKFLFPLLGFVSLVFFLASEDIIRLLFYRGNFTMSSVKSAAMYLKYFGLLPAFLAINTLVSRLFMATQEIRLGVFYQILVNCMSIPLLVLSIEYLGPVGYPVSWVIVYSFSSIFVCYLLWRYFSYINSKVFTQFILFAAIVLSLIGLSLNLFIKYFNLLYPSSLLFCVTTLIAITIMWMIIQHQMSNKLD